MDTLVVRRTATGLFGAGLAIMLFAVYVALVFYENSIGVGADWVAQIDFYAWVILLSTLLILILVGLLILYFLPPVTTVPEEEGVAPHSADDDVAQYEAVAETAAAEAITEALVVKCTNCGTEFDLPYSTERPLHGTCPQCGEEAVLEEDEAVLATGGEPVIDIEGIGPAYAEKLGRAGVTSTEQLRRASTERLAEQTGISETLLLQWKAMADFMRIKGIGKQYAELLARAGVTGVEDLAKETPSRLRDRVAAYLKGTEHPPTKGRVDEKRARRWIQAARKMAA